MAFNFEKALRDGYTPQQITNYLTSQGRETEAQQKFGVDPKPFEESKGYISRVKEDIVKQFGGAKESVIRGAELMAEPGISKPIQGIVRSGLGTAGAATRALFSPITEALSPIISPVIENALGGEKTQEVLILTYGKK